MMVKPSVTELLKKVDNQFELVVMTAKRCISKDIGRHGGLCCGGFPKRFVKLSDAVLWQESDHFAG